ncbi:acyl-CoA dehydrogenase family protein [Kutzneria sp. NPDC052558]|uniref:acyl-CoA dehydrogenase family protein n=1 Tax=Kutzneria sp. NPDC052558 TaxID=3364121 RepID=UPI0037C8A806
MTDAELVAKEVRAVLAGEPARKAFAAMAAKEGEPDPRPLYRLLGERGLLAVSWPVAYGGRGLSARCAATVVGEMIAGRVPEVLHTLSVQICGNFLLTAGAEEQRAAVLPGLAAGTLAATVLYSEGEVGSDLSSLATRAEPVPGGWRITGRKIYSVKTAFADIGLVAARTSTEKTLYQGITLFLVPLTAPGVTVAVLPSIADEDFADVLLDGVEVPGSAVVGPIGGAWPLITEALALERTGVDYVAKAELWLGDGQNDRLRTRIAAARALAMRCVDQQDTGRVDPVAAAVTKYWCSETATAVAWWRVDTGQTAADAVYREAPGLTLSAGTSEMMLELVANSGLDAGALDDEPLAAELRKAVRAVASSYDDRDPARACWPDLARLGFFGFTVPVEHGGLDLGLRAAVVCCAELGRELHDDGLLDALTAIDTLVQTSPGDLADALSDRPSPVDVHGDSPAARIRRAAWLTGLAAGCLAHTVRRAQTRQQFGRTLIENQDVAFRLARLKIWHDAVAALVGDLAGRFDDGDVDAVLAAGALAEAQALALAATREGMQLHGAYGMTAQSPVARYYLAAVQS